MTYTLTIDNDTTSGSEARSVMPSSSADNMPGGVRDLIPAFIPRDQVYYWSFAWQEGEGRVRQQLTAGEGVEFDDPREMVRWLLSDAD